MNSGEIGEVGKGCFNKETPLNACDNPDKDNQRFIKYSNIIVVAP